MSLIGRIVAAARELPLGGPLGSLLGRAARCLPQSLAQRVGGTRSPDPRRSIAFTIAVIALGAKMAKADGTVSRDEVAAFREVFQVPPQEEAHLRRVFDLARRSTAGFDSYARQVGRLFAGNRASWKTCSAACSTSRWPTAASVRPKTPICARWRAISALPPPSTSACARLLSGHRRWR